MLSSLLFFHLWIRNLFHQLRKQPSEADARDDVEQQAGIEVALTTDRDEYLPGDRMADEQCR